MKRRIKKFEYVEAFIELKNLKLIAASEGAYLRGRFGTCIDVQGSLEGIIRDYFDIKEHQLEEENKSK